ncbi:MAG: hypothetical protein R2847_06155 [Bacteroidia bacterium]
MEVLLIWDKFVITANKARGRNWLRSPINDPFDIDYVAHEWGISLAATILLTV